MLVKSQKGRNWTRSSKLERLLSSGVHFVLHWSMQPFSANVQLLHASLSHRRKQKNIQQRIELTERFQQVKQNPASSQGRKKYNLFTGRGSQLLRLTDDLNQIVSIVSSLCHRCRLLQSQIDLYFNVFSYCLFFGLFVSS